MADLRELFRRHVCQTSPMPMGLEIVAAHGARLTTAEGEDYLDLLAGIGVVNIGHGRREIVEAIEHQAKKYLHAMVYGEMILEPQVEYARELCRVLPGPIDCVYFTNSGTEAVEGALKTARKYTGRPRILSFEGCYHGDTMGALSLQSDPRYRKPYEPLLPAVQSLPWNTMEALDAVDRETAAVIIEPIQGEGGVRIPDDDFMLSLRRRCSQTGALLIMDEVMTGFARTGRMFACEHWNVVPDLLVMAKAVGGGLPLGAFAGPRRIMSTLSDNPPLAHVTTFGGHPLSCASGLASLKIIVQEDLCRRAALTGENLLKGLRELQTRHPCIREVRGKGCLLAIEFHRSADCRAFVSRCMERKLITGWTLFRDDVVRLAPPLILTDEDIDLILERFHDSLRLI